MQKHSQVDWKFPGNFKLPKGVLGCEMIDSDCLRNKSVDEVMVAQVTSYVNVPPSIPQLLTCLPWYFTIVGI